ncbi:MAG TPA: hypothetical protein VHX14_03295 [Thermoanaerobaculia bacterium]|nr:hypothetical protein [Thermoanaerobaculia bacterium]
MSLRFLPVSGTEEAEEIDGEEDDKDGKSAKRDGAPAESKICA